MNREHKGINEKFDQMRDTVYLYLLFILFVFILKTCQRIVMLIFWHVICIVMEPNIYIDLGTVTLGLFKFHDILLCELVYF